VTSHQKIDKYGAWVIDTMAQFGSFDTVLIIPRHVKSKYIMRSMKGKVSNVAFESSVKSLLRHDGVARAFVQGRRKKPFSSFPCIRSYVPTDRKEVVDDVVSLEHLIDARSTCNSSTLWEDNKHLFYASLLNPFVQDLANGVLPKEVFETYLSQDIHYLGVFEDALSTMHDLIQLEIGVHAVHSKEAKQRALELLHSVQAEISSLHSSLIGNEQEKDVSWATKSYIDFLRKIQTDPKSSVAEILASLIPCFRLYAEIARYLDENVLSRLDSHDSHPYFHWIKEYASPRFLAHVQSAEWIFDLAVTRDARITGMFQLDALAFR